MASRGHVRDLPDNDVHVGPAPSFKPEYDVIADQRETIARLADAARGRSVYLGMDPDREGESIAWHLAECLKLKDAKRVRFNEITSNAVRAGIASASSIDMALVDAQQ